MRAILIIFLTLITFNIHAGKMSTIDLMVREAASEDYGYNFYDSWQIKFEAPNKDCLATVSASTIAYIKSEWATLTALYCITKSESGELLISPIN